MGALLIGFVLYESFTTVPIEVPLAGGDKYGHILAYATLMFWFAQIYPGRRRRIEWAFAFVVMGIAIEFLQGLTDYRSFEIADMVAGAVGVCVGWLVSPPRSPHLLRWIETRLNVRAR